MAGSLGERMAARRQQLGWSQIQLAAAAGLTPSAISLFESGKRKPSFEALKKLSEALGVSADFFTDERPGTAAAEVSDPRLRSLVDGFGLLDNAGRDQLMEAALGLLARRAGGAIEAGVSGDPRAAARELLERLGLHYPPVDPLLVACLLGLTVRMAPLADVDCEALLDRRIAPPLLLIARPEVAAGRPLPENRLRFTIAHLLAHHLLPHHRALTYRCRQIWAEAGDDPAEQEANAFAAELLMPGPMLERLRSAPQPEADASGPLEMALAMASRFKTSVPVGVLQWARYSDQPCAALLTEGDRVRQAAVSPSFPHALLGQVPPGALCIATRGQKGLQRRTCDGSQWLARAEGVVLTEEAYHYNLGAEQSVTMLTLAGPADHPGRQR